MKTAVITVKTDPQVKKQAQQIAKSLGFSLSTLVNAYLKEFIETKTVLFSKKPELTAYAKKALAESEKNFKDGDHSPPFTNVKDAMKWLNS